MSHDQLPQSQQPATHELPSIDEVVAPEKDFQFQEESGLSTQRLVEQDDSTNRFWTKGKMAVAGGVAVVATAIGGALVATGGGEKSNPTPERSPAASATPNPGETNPPTESLIAQERAEMYYAYESDYFISDEFYANNPPSTEGGPGGYSDPTEYIDQTVVQDLANDLLHNMTVATETGSEDAIIATFAQESDGNFGEMQDEVDALRDRHELIQEFIAQYPDYPIGSLELQSIDSVSPDTANKDRASITFTVVVTSYGNYKEGKEPAAFSSIESWSWDLERREVDGFSASSATTMWVITNAATNSSEIIPS